MSTLALVSAATITTTPGEVVFVSVTTDVEDGPVFREPDGDRLHATQDPDTAIWTAFWATRGTGVQTIRVEAGNATPVTVAVTLTDDGPPPPQPGDSFADELVAALIADEDSATAAGLTGAITAAARPVDRLRDLQDKWRAKLLATQNRNTGYGTSIGAWSGAATSITGGVNVDAILSPFGAYSINPAFTYLGADPDRHGSNYPAQVAVKGFGLTATASDLPYRVAFWHEDASALEVRAFAVGGVYNNRLRVWVDGVAIDGDPFDGPGGGGAEFRTRIALPDATKRLVILEWSGINVWFSGITRDPAAKVSRWVGPVGPRRIALGDSQLEGQNGEPDRIGNPLGFFPLICQTAGVLDYWQSGLGETGLLADGSAHDRANQVTRLADDVLARNPDEVWMFASQNDANQTKAALKTALNTNLDAIFADNPDCTVKLIGNYLPRGGAGLTTVRDAYAEVAATRGMAFLDASTFLTDANLDDYLVDPGVNDHLSPLGHREFAVWVLARLEAGYTQPGA